jgi:hypothetical protein
MVHGANLFEPEAAARPVYQARSFGSVRPGIPHSPIVIAVAEVSFVRLILSHVSSNLRLTPSVGTGLDYSTIDHWPIAEAPRPSLGNVARPCGTTH